MMLVRLPMTNLKMTVRADYAVSVCSQTLFCIKASPPACRGWESAFGQMSAHPLPTPAPSCQQPVGQEILQVEGGDYIRKQYMALTVIFKLVIWVVLGIVNLHFQGLFVPISLRPVLGTVAARVLGTVWSLCS